jgi:lysozyme family protein
MQQDYQAFVERMIARYEGGYGWDRRDPGGPTKFGITCYDLAEYLGEKMNSMSAWAPRVKAMTLATADEIYKKKYATACQFDALNAGCDCVVFDFGVNSGSSQ